MYNTIAEWSSCTKWLIILVNAFMVLLLGYWLVIHEISQRLIVQEKQHLILQQTLLSKEKAIKNLPALRKQVQLLQQLVNMQVDSFAICSLRMVGIVRQGEKIWALLSAPDNKVYAVTQGMHLDNTGEIVQIDAQKIIIKKNNKTIILGLIKHD